MYFGTRIQFEGMEENKFWLGSGKFFGMKIREKHYSKVDFKREPHRYQNPIHTKCNYSSEIKKCKVNVVGQNADIIPTGFGIVRPEYND